MSRKKKIDTIIYWLLLTVYACVLAVGIWFALKTVWDVSIIYQDSMIGPVLDEYVAGLNTQLIGESVAETVSSMPHEFQTDEECLAIIDEMFSDEIRYVRSNSDDPNLDAYALRCGKSTFGKVYLIRDESKPSGVTVLDREIQLPWDMRPWLVYKEEFDFTGLYSSVEVTIPQTYSLQLNGQTVGEQYIVERDIPYDSLEDYYDVNPDLPRKVTYRFDNIIGTLEPVILDESGSVYVVDETRDDSQYLKPCSEEQLYRLNDFCAKFTSAYLEYSSGKFGKNSANGYYALQQYVVAGSSLDTKLYTALDGLIEWSHTSSFSLDYYQLVSAVDLGGGYYVCNIYAETTDYTQGNGEQHSQTELSVIVIDSGAQIKAIALT